MDSKVACYYQFCELGHFCKVNSHSYRFNVFLPCFEHVFLIKSEYSYCSNYRNTFLNFNVYSDLVIFDIFHSGLPTKNETLETMVRNLFSLFSCIKGSLQAKTVLFLCLPINKTTDYTDCSYILPG